MRGSATPTSGVVAWSTNWNELEQVPKFGAGPGVGGGVPSHCTHACQPAGTLGTPPFLSDPLPSRPQENETTRSLSLHGFALPAVALLALALGAGASAVATPTAGETSAEADSAR